MSIPYKLSARVWTAFAGAASAAVVNAAAAQVPQLNRAERVPADTLLARFERGTEDINDPASVWIFHSLRTGTSPPAREDSLLIGLERIAVASPRENVRTLATDRIAVAGEQGRTRSKYPVVAALARIYSADANAGLVRLRIRNHMPLQTDRRGAVEFLKRVVMEPESRGQSILNDMANPRTHALARLAEMGDEGRVALQELHRNAQRLSPAARSMIQSMAARGFPVRNARPPGFPSQPTRP